MLGQEESGVSAGKKGQKASDSARDPPPSPDRDQRGAIIRSASPTPSGWNPARELMSEEKRIAIDAAAEKAAVDSMMDGRGEGRAKSRKRRKVSYLTVSKIDHVDYKDVDLLRRFLTERGKIVPSRQSGNTAKQQRMITRAIKRAREMALLPFVVADLNDELLVRRPRPAATDAPR